MLGWHRSSSTNCEFRKESLKFLYGMERQPAGLWCSPLLGIHYPPTWESPNVQLCVGLSNKASAKLALDAKSSKHGSLVEGSFNFPYPFWIPHWGWWCARHPKAEHLQQCHGQIAWEQYLYTDSDINQGNLMWVYNNLISLDSSLTLCSCEQKGLQSIFKFLALYYAKY
ncbi:hypothetical protein PR048_029984 [Dryococelus australis]|uniref:Uncharacterized protein n=1 Tax=Dryococelus australis TaxID=614101 RepID=A0ABQ9GBL3_9NEOP|nr:hypothetical protein PR048_029984 [Dryococelus australis]